jgi:hypothetical protein
MALIYLVAWPVTLAGVFLISLSGQWAYAIFVPGAITLTLWAFDLDGRDPEARDRVPAAPRPLRLKSWQVTWYRVILGIELPRAWRTFRGINPTFPKGKAPTNTATPKSRR